MPLKNRSETVAWDSRKKSRYRKSSFFLFALRAAVRIASRGGSHFVFVPRSPSPSRGAHTQSYAIVLPLSRTSPVPLHAPVYPDRRASMGVYRDTPVRAFLSREATTVVSQPVFRISLCLRHRTHTPLYTIRTPHPCPHAPDRATMEENNQIPDRASRFFTEEARNLPPVSRHRK